MSAITLDDYLKQGCAENGGVEDVVVCEVEDVDSYTVANREITALTMKTGKQAYKWTPDLESAFATDNGNRNSDNNAYWKLHTLMVQFKDDEDLTAQISEDAGRVFLIAFVKFAQPEGETVKYKAYGFFNGLRLTTEESGTGQRYEDLRGHTLNFEVKELTRALKVSDTIVDSLLDPPS